MSQSVIEERQGKTSSRKVTASLLAIPHITSDGQTNSQGTGSLRLLLSYLSSRAQDHLPRNGAYHSGLGPPPSVINKDNSPKTCSQVKQGISPLTLPSQVSLGCIKLTVKATRSQAKLKEDGC